MTSPILPLPEHLRFIEVTSDNLTTIQALLRANQLPFEDCGDHLSNFVGIAKDDQIIATSGFEHIGQLALLRSVTVDPKFRGQGLAASLIANRLSQMRWLRVEAVYSLTETAQQYLSRFGFEIVDRDSLPPGIQTTQQCQSLCPASATAMRLML